MGFKDVSAGDYVYDDNGYLPLPHDQDQSEAGSGAVNDVAEGMAVTLDANGNIAKADTNGEGTALGVLGHYNYFGEDDTIDQERAAQVAMETGVVTARVDSAVTAGDSLAAPDTSGDDTAGVFDTTNATADSNYVALADAWQNPADSEYYAPVLLK